MRFLLVAVLFLLAVAGSTAVVKFGYQASVEKELEDRSKSALEEAGLAGVEVSFDHHDAILSGHVDRIEDKVRVLEIVGDAVPVSVLPDPTKVDISIRPTLDPEIEIRKLTEKDILSLSGSIAIGGEANRTLLGTRLLALENISHVENRIDLDPMRLPFQQTAEMASLAEGLFSYPGEARISLKAGILSLTGRVPNDGIKQSLLELAALIQAESLEDHITVLRPETLKSFSEYSITRNRFGSIVTGIVASESHRSRLRELIEASSEAGRVTDRLEVSDEVVVGPAEKAAPSIIPALIDALTGEFTADFSSDRVRLIGTVVAEEHKTNLTQVMSSLRAESPELEILLDLAVRGGDSQGPPIQLLASYDPDRLVLTGNLPDLAFLNELRGSLADEGSTLKIKSELEHTPSSPGSNWIGGLADLFQELDGRVEFAVIKIEEGELTLEGTTISSADRQLLHNMAINVLPKEYTINNQLEHVVEEPFPTPALLPEERTKLAEALKQLPIYFASNSEVVNSDESEKVTQIAAMIKDAGAPLSLIVTGFADNVGNAEYNRQLSLRRANSVVAILMGQGITQDSMTTDSVGEDVSQVSRRDRWKARRVEVSLASTESEENGNPEEDSN